MIMVMVILIIIIISRMKPDEVELGTLNKFMSRLELHKTAFHARARIDMI